ncbi:MAG: mononuclear molybdenum enzyme YedY, partial [Paracoccus sp. (in: a-proteobacteria)]
MKLTWSDVTPKAHWLDRRAFIATAAALSASPALALSGKPSGLSTDEKPNTLEEITNYNNYYEFGTGKEDPARNAGGLKTDPWSVEIGGLVDRPGSYGVEDLAPENTL